MRFIGLFLVCCLSMVPSGIHAQKISIAKYADNCQAAISFTFDDGLKEQYSILFPKMKELGIKGTFCLIGSRMEFQPKNPEKQTFSWEQAKEMAQDGQEITSHGYNHKNVTKLTAEELRYEVQHNDTLIYQHTGFFPPHLFLSRQQEERRGGGILQQRPCGNANLSGKSWQQAHPGMV